jgi:prepilin-type N-terminal cleavage/methylation domain-containing protein
MRLCVKTVSYTGGFTLVEILVVVIIVGILATLGISQFAGPREQAIEREGIVNLKLIAAAEKIYRLETNSYITTANTANTNNVLRLSLPVSNAYWNYSVPVANANSFQAVARRVRLVTGRPAAYCINNTAEEPAAGTTVCP